MFNASNFRPVINCCNNIKLVKRGQFVNYSLRDTVFKRKLYRANINKMYRFKENRSKKTFLKKKGDISY